MDNWTRSDWFDFSTIIIGTIVTILVAIPTFYQWLKSLLINNTWKKIILILNKIEIISPWNKYKDHNERWIDFVRDLTSQKVLWFASNEILNGFMNIVEHRDNFYKLKDYLQKESFRNVFLINKKWNLIFKKISKIVNILLSEFEFIMKKDNDITYTNKTIIENKDIVIEKTRISPAYQLDAKLWEIPPITFDEFPDSKNSIKINIEGDNENWLKMIIHELKNDDFIFNIRFKREQEKKICYNLAFSIHFNDNKIKKIQTSYDNKEESLDESVFDCLAILKKMFNIEKIEKLIPSDSKAKLKIIKWEVEQHD